MKQNVPAQLHLLEELLYKPCGLAFQNIELEEESAEYAAAKCLLNDLVVHFRTAKITPKKVGQFVTFWKRTAKGSPILPYEESDLFDLLIVSVHAQEQFGQFIFPKKALCKQGLLFSPGREGKRAMRVYPPWDYVDSPQAKQTQDWQAFYFLDLSPGVAIDFTRAKNLLF